MFLRSSFQPTPSRWAFEPESFQQTYSSLNRIERHLMGYRWQGTSKHRVLTYGTVELSWFAVDERLAPYMTADYETALHIGEDAGYWRDDNLEWDYSTVFMPAASYDGSSLKVLNASVDTGPLIEYMDARLGARPLLHPRGTDGWWLGHALPPRGDLAPLRLFHYQQFKDELEAVATISVA